MCQPMVEQAASLRFSTMKTLLWSRGFGRDGVRSRRARRRGPVVRAGIFVFLIVCALITAVVVTLSRNASHTNRQQVATELASGARVASSSFSAIRANLRARASQLATSLDLQRAIVAGDNAAIRRIATGHHAQIHARGAVYGSLAPRPRIVSSAMIAQGAAVVARVTLAVPLDRSVLRLVREATPLPPNAALVLASGDRVVAGAPIGSSAVVRNGMIRFGSSEFMATAAKLNIADVTVLAVEPIAAVDARGLPYRRKVLIAALLTLALAAGVAARLGRPLARMFGELSNEADTDSLTGLANRRSFDERLDEELDRARRHGTHLSLVLADLDDFKQVNDRYGHQAGDDVLRGAADVFGGSLRELDLAARYGGEECALLRPGTTLAGAHIVAEQVREALASVAVDGPDGKPIHVTASFGVAEFPSCAGIDALIAAADSALYAAKRAGKNRVAPGGDEGEPGSVSAVA
jgi:diguanylate cyclase (GGDEF)-like protein